MINGSLLGSKRASWARPRRPNRDNYGYGRGHDGNDYYDDCPDGFDRDEWDAYCEGRGD